jgi:6-pyruvoyltetrahydropterin/6-carboxytetrahydropterin synthase
MTAERPVVYLSRRESFCASHRLWEPTLSREGNERLYGKCARDNGHGHNYVIQVTLRGGVDPATGMVINLTDLKQFLRDHIIDKVDHFHLNHDVEMFRGVNPTSENVALVFWNVLRHRFGELLHEVRVEETPDNIVSYRGEWAAPVPDVHS